jgi:hypothetical protein
MIGAFCIKRAPGKQGEMTARRENMHKYTAVTPMDNGATRVLVRWARAASSSLKTRGFWFRGTGGDLIDGGWKFFF